MMLRTAAYTITGGFFDDNTHSAYRHFKQHSLERTLLGVLPQDPCHNNVNPQINLFFIVNFRIKSFLLKSSLSRLGFNAAYRVEFSHFRDRAWRINLTCHIGCPRMWHRFSFIKYSISRVSVRALY